MRKQISPAALAVGILRSATRKGHGGGALVRRSHSFAIFGSWHSGAEVAADEAVDAGGTPLPELAAAVSAGVGVVSVAAVSDAGFEHPATRAAHNATIFQLMSSPSDLVPVVVERKPSIAVPLRWSAGEWRLLSSALRAQTVRPAPGIGLAAFGDSCRRTHARTTRGDRPMASSRQRSAARRNVRKAAAAARRKKTISKLPASTRTALGKQGAKTAARKRRARRGAKHGA